MAYSEGEDTGAPSSDVAEWLSRIDEARKEMRDYEDRCKRVRKRYLYDNAQTAKRRKFQMLWANQEILRPAVYAKRPSPSVTNRWKDGDAVARIACELVERNLDFQFDICDFDSAFKLVRDDFLLYARGTARVRYEPTFKTADVDTGGDGEDAGGPEAAAKEGEPGDEAEELQFENVHLDFIQLQDFVHPKTRTWKELPWLAFTSYMDRAALKKRFPACGDEVQLDTVDEGKSDDRRVSNSKAARKATVHEIWDKEAREVLWVSPGYADLLDSGPPYLKFEGFFPCPRPAYGTLASDSLIPVPDFVFYQDQAEEIDDLTARIASLSDSLKLVGFYPAGPSGEGAPEIAMAVRPGFENKMIAVRSWAAFTNNGRNASPIVWLPIEQVGEILKGCVELRKQLIDDVYQITGLSDIIRGTTEAEETAAAQGLKSQWGSLRLKSRQNELARFSRDVTRLAAEVIANHFQVANLAKCANMKIPTEAEQQAAIEQFKMQLAQWQRLAQAHQMAQQGAPPVAPGAAPSGPPAAPPGQSGASPPGGPPLPPQPQPPKVEPTQEQIEQLLRDGVTRRFLIDIETDSTIAADENAEKASRTQVLEAISKFVVAWMPIIQAQPELLPLAGEMLLFAVRAFPAARELEEAIEQAMDKMQEAAGQPKQPGPEQLKAQSELAKAKAEIEKAQIDAQSAQAKAKADIEAIQLKSQTAIQEHQMKMQQMQAEGQMTMAKMQSEHQLETQKMQMQHSVAREQIGMQHQLETAKANHAQKTLAQQAQIDEQRMVASQAMDQFKVHSERQLMDSGHENAMELANVKAQPKKKD